MSHIVTINTEIRDPTSLQAACQRQSLAPPQFGSHQLYRTRVIGWAVQLPEWRYPVVCQTETGELQFDNFQGHWGDPQHLDRMLQAYAVERATLEARRQGYAISEQALPDGSIKLTVAVRGLS